MFSGVLWIGHCTLDCRSPCGRQSENSSPPGSQQGLTLPCRIRRALLIVEASQGGAGVGNRTTVAADGYRFQAEKRSTHTLMGCDPDVTR